MQTISISRARSTLPELVQQVAATRQSVVLLRYGKPAAVIAPMANAVDQTDPYPLRDAQIVMGEDFDAPLDDLWGACHVDESAPPEP